MIREKEKQELTAALENTFNRFIRELASIPDDKVNQAPFSGSWTPAQVASHIILATDGVPDASSEPSTRDYADLLPGIRPWWEDYSQKFSSPDILLPDDNFRSKQELIGELNRVRDKNIQITLEQDLSLICLDMELPTIGYLTRYEWLHFIEMHVRRHLYQLKKMNEIVPHD